MNDHSFTTPFPVKSYGAYCRRVMNDSCLLFREAEISDYGTVRFCIIDGKRHDLEFKVIDGKRYYLRCQACLDAEKLATARQVHCPLCGSIRP